MAWWGWLLLGLLLALQAWRSVYLWGCAAAAALWVAAVSGIFPAIDFTAQWGAWAIFSVMHVALWSHRRTTAAWPPLLLGRSGQLTESLPAFHRGTVVLDRAIDGKRRWCCLCARDLVAGSRVEVVEFGPDWLKVVPLEGEHSGR